MKVKIALIHTMNYVSDAQRVRWRTNLNEKCKKIRFSDVAVMFTIVTEHDDCARNNDKNYCWIKNRHEITKNVE